ITATLEDFLARDDVFIKAFLTTVLLSIEGNDSANGPINAPTNFEGSIIINIADYALNGTLIPGPYFLAPDGSITKAYRLYPDPNFAFVESVTGPDADGTYVPVSGSTGDGVNGGVSIAVPSRLYYPPPSAERPLEGLRLGVKDIFDLQGIRTSAGSRSLFALDRIANDTGSALQSLIDLGAVVVGKLKTTQFALSEIPTGDYIDQLGPYNPRGDGYQNPQGSSVGTGVAVASYDWLDFGTGTDTGGSIRFPSMQNGVFGMRISNGSLPLDGLLPISPRFDTPGLLTRSAALLKTAYGAWLPTTNYSSYPKRIILPAEFWPPVNATPNVNASFNVFLSSMAGFLGASLELISQNESFIAYTNISAGINFLGESYSNVSKYDQVHLTRDPIIAEYEQRYGAYPFFDPLPTLEWSWGEQVTINGYMSGLSRILTYQDWFRSEMVPSCEESLVVYPMGAGIPQYRNVYKAPPVQFGAAYTVTLQAVYSGCPDYTVPFGVTRYNSTISQREEELPLSVGIIAAAGCDTMLADLVADMAENGVI
ncbi:amidase signature domain-containing protein, partial [Xylariales sp. PMI_506]